MCVSCCCEIACVCCLLFILCDVLSKWNCDVAAYVCWSFVIDHADLFLLICVYYWLNVICAVMMCALCLLLNCCCWLVCGECSVVRAIGSSSVVD